VGQTPTVYHLDRRDRVSVISGISVSPVRQRLNLHFQLHTANITQVEVRNFLRLLLRAIPGHLVVVWDRFGPHRSSLVRALCARSSRLHLHHFPAYAPDFNPDEGVWANAKRTLANGRCRNLSELLRAVSRTLVLLGRNPKTLRGCITHSALPPFLR
jgi:transposase